jgi:transglutaminase-like putative cysteine protease
MQTAGGESAIWTAVQVMRGAIVREAMKSDVRLFASRLTASCAPADVACRASRIYAYVKAHMRFVPDPRQVEALGLPSYHLQLIAERNETYGDCDDGAMLIATLATAVGVTSRLAVASFRPDRILHHVWAGLLVPRGWFEADPFRSERFNRQPTRVLYLSV